MENALRVKPLYWVASSKKDLLALPEEVVDVFGYALYLAQIGTVRFTCGVFVLHIFQKKAKRGIATPKADLDLIRERLKAAEQAAREKEQ